MDVSYRKNQTMAWDDIIAILDFFFLCYFIKYSTSVYKIEIRLFWKDLNNGKISKFHYDKDRLFNQSVISKAFEIVKEKFFLNCRLTY